MIPQAKMENIVLGGGCFWCTEAVFKMLKGVTSVRPGYTGGNKPNPTYQDVCSGSTGHTEVVEIEYDPEQISLQDLLVVFFATHDPTSLNKQGHDVGEEYRSAIFYTTEEQKRTAEASIAELNASAKEGEPIVTEMKPLQVFYPADSSHQNFYARNQEAPYCRIVINPKLEKVREQFSELMKTSSQT